MLLWQLGFRVITLGAFCSLPGHLKRAVEDKLDRYSDKTFHCTTSAAYANDFLGLLPLDLCVIMFLGGVSNRVSDSVSDEGRGGGA